MRERIVGMKREYRPLKKKLRVDLLGMRYGRLTVVSALGSFKDHVYWLCKCDCGGSIEVETGKLNNGNTVSCGCAKAERMRAINAGHVTHGKSGTRVYASWSNMMRRVYDPTDTHYHRYGGRGIVVEDRFHDFSEFYEYMGDPPDGLTLERKNNDLGYVTGNMVWATQSEQQRNKSTNVMIDIGGVDVPAIDVANGLGVSQSKFMYRHHKGMSVEEIMSVPHNTKRPVMYKGELTSIQRVCDETGIGYSCLWARIHRQGLSVEDAVKKGIPC